MNIKKRFIIALLASLFAVAGSCTSNISHVPEQNKSTKKDRNQGPSGSGKRKMDNTTDRKDTSGSSSSGDEIGNRPVTDQMLKKGKSIFQKTCAPCHGTKGKGNGPAATGLDPKPRNYQKNGGKWMKQQTNEHLFKTIKHGGAAVGLSPIMPSHKNQLSDREIRAVVGYIRKLANGK